MAGTRGMTTWSPDDRRHPGRRARRRAHPALRHAERISGLDAREASHYQQIAARLRELAAEAASASTRIDGIDDTLARHAMIVNGLDGLDGQVADLALQLAELAASGGDDGQPGYQPVSPPRWWKLTAAERDAATDRLRAWVDQIYRPGYGKLAAALPPCWEHHPLCLYALDWLSELWSVLYLDPDGPAAPSPPRPNGRPACSPQPPNRWPLRRPDAATAPLTHDGLTDRVAPDPALEARAIGRPHGYLPASTCERH